MSGKVGGSISLSVGFVQAFVADEAAARALRTQVEEELAGVVTKHFLGASPSVTAHLTFTADPVEVQEAEPTTQATGINTTQSGTATTE